MTKPVELRLRAAEDVDAAIDHYQQEGGAPLAIRFVDALEEALRHLGRFLRPARCASPLSPTSPTFVSGR